MWYPRQDSSAGLSTAAREAESLEGLSGFADYCRLREKGVRREAFAALRRFLDEARGWPWDKRTRFVDWVLTFMHEHPSAHELNSEPLMTGLVLPTLDEWCAREPGNPAPWRWRGSLVFDEDHQDLRRAIELDPREQLAREQLIGRRLTLIDGYMEGLSQVPVDLAEKALATLSEIERLVEELEPSRGGRAGYAREVHDYREVLQSYLDFKRSGSPLGFEQWADANGRRHSV
jgi:hypothetical protein